MQVKQIMTSNPETIEESTSILLAAQSMKAADIGTLPVTKNGLPVGIVTDRDIVVRGVSQGLDAETATVSAVMTENLDTLSMDADITEAARLMEEKEIRRVGVVDTEGKLAGIVSLGDLAGRGHESTLSGEVIEKICGQGLHTT